MSRSNSNHNYANGNNARLSMIAEDENAVPSAADPKLARTSNRSHNRRWSDQPPRHSYEPSPPEYDVWDKSRPDRRRRMNRLQNNPHIVKRGGWKRLLVILLLLLAVVIALGVGLGVDLTRNKQSSSVASPPQNASTDPLPFPIGDYAIPAYLANVLTSCTSNSATFNCYPYMTYSSSEPGSMVTFNWVISSPTNSTDNLTLSTSQNPFANTFSNVALTLQDQGTDDEHYAFSLSLQKIVVPNMPISSDGASANCYYNTTTFAGALYTKKPHQNTTDSAPAPGASAGAGMGSMPSSPGNGDWKPWPYAVNVTQSINGGQGIPECFEFSNDGQTGSLIGGLTPQPESTLCECNWMNYDLG